jgi:hypothetical protein
MEPNAKNFSQFQMQSYAAYHMNNSKTVKEDIKIQFKIK